MERKPTVVLVAFYNVKALGVRYLETALTKAGYHVTTIFFKQFNSISPSLPTEKELQLLCDKIEQAKPVLVGLSVMSSLYLEAIHAVIHALQERNIGPLVCGGAAASLFPEHLLDQGVPFVTRLDGEISLVKLADALRTGASWENNPSLCYRKDGKNVINPIGDILDDINEFSPTVDCPDACLIDNDTVTPGDPQRSTLSYEVVASRGCPFNCTYCGDPNLRRLNPPGIRPVRTRSVKNVIDELIQAKRVCKKIAFVHFYDEIFPHIPGWVDEFVVEYKKHIDLPFTIWNHPKATDPELLTKLRSVGLSEVIMGIQSGSPHIRNDIFHRYETNEEIIKATQTIHRSGVFWATYDFILQHPFETLEELKESYELIKQMEGPFELQLHGLNFLPGTDIVPMAIEKGYLTQEEMDAVMFAPMSEQFNAFHMGSTDREGNLWFDLMFLWQFKSFQKKCLEYEKDVLAHEKEILRDYAKAQKMAKLRYVYKKSAIVFKRIFHSF